MDNSTEMDRVGNGNQILMSFSPFNSDERKGISHGVVDLLTSVGDMVRVLFGNLSTLLVGDSSEFSLKGSGDGRHCFKTL